MPSDSRDTPSEHPIVFSAPMVSAILDGRKSQTRRIIDLSDKKALSLDQRKLGWTCNPSLARVGDVGKMVAALAGKRREIVEQQISVPARHPADSNIPWEDCGYERIYCPYGGVGDQLWVREAFVLESWTFEFGDEPPVPSDRPHRHIMHEDLSEVWLFPHYRATEPEPHIVSPDAAEFDDRTRWSSPIHMPRWASRITLEIDSVRVERAHQITDADVRAEGIAPGQIDKWRKFLDPRDVHGQAFGESWNKINGEGSWESNPWVWAVAFHRLTEGA